MTTAMTFATITVEYPDVSIRGKRILIGRQEESHDGTLITCYTNYKWQWHIKWSNLTLAQYLLIQTAADTVTSQSMTLPMSATTYTVVVKQGSVEYEATPTEDYYTVEFDVEESV